MIGYIYLARNTKDNMVYVGQTRKSPEERKKSHRKLAKYYPFRICRAIVKDGFDAFTWEVLEEVEGIDKADMQAKLNEAERKYISMYRSYDPSIGYNDTYGGRDGVMTERVLKQIQITRRNNDKDRVSLPPKRRSEEVRKKMSDAQKKRHREIPVSEESRQRQSESLKKYYSIPANRERRREIMSGRKLSEEHIKNIKKAQKNAKLVKCVETGVEYASIKEAARMVHTSPSDIRRSVREHKKVKGVSFQFI